MDTHGPETIATKTSTLILRARDELTQQQKNQKEERRNKKEIQKNGLYMGNPNEASNPYLHRPRGYILGPPKAQKGARRNPKRLLLPPLSCVPI